MKFPIQANPIDRKNSAKQFLISMEVNISVPRPQSCSCAWDIIADRCNVTSNNCGNMQPHCNQIYGSQNCLCSCR